MKKFIYTAEVVIEAENKEDAQIEIIFKMNEHDICWEVEIQD